jgi:phage-related protein
MPSFPYGESHSPRTIPAKFGDGYSQEVLDGINTDEYTMEMQWNGLYTSEQQTIIGFLSGTALTNLSTYMVPGVTRFYFTPPAPNGVPTQQTFMCPKWKVEETQGGVWNVTATFVRKFDLG